MPCPPYTRTSLPSRITALSFQLIEPPRHHHHHHHHRRHHHRCATPFIRCFPFPLAAFSSVRPDDDRPALAKPEPANHFSRLTKRLPPIGGKISVATLVSRDRGCADRVPGSPLLFVARLLADEASLPLPSLPFSSLPAAHVAEIRR